MDQLTDRAPVLETLGLACAVAIAEEAVFRGLLTPAHADTPPRRTLTVASVVGFVVWHLLQGAVWPPARRWFWRGDFLTATALLGAACTLLRQRSGSIWPGVALHAAVIVIWKSLAAERRA